MKKEEAKELAIKRVDLILEYIEQILLDENVESMIKFDSFKVDNQNMCTLDIYVKPSNFERHFNLGINVQHIDVLYERLFKVIIDRYLDNSDVELSLFKIIKGIIGEDFNGFSITNSNGSIVNINFLVKGVRFKELKDNYNDMVFTKIIEEDNIENIDRKSK